MTTGGRIVGVAGIDPAFEKKRRDGKAFAFAGAIIMLALSGLLWAFSRNAMGDFKVVYYSARTFLQHGNPYNEQDVLRVYQAEGRERPDEIAENRAVFTRFIYMPPTFVVTLPIAAAGFTAGQFIWAALEAASLLLAAWAVWDLSYKAAPLPAGGLIGLLLSGSFWMLMMGNSAAISVGLCIFGIWSFLRERNIVAGVLCMAISLALKPHDAGPVWLFLLVTGPTLRRRAWQALFAAAAIGLPWLIYAQLFFCIGLNKCGTISCFWVGLEELPIQDLRALWVK
ncbi:MAG TPA: glycosyltransferase 87 family protein [Terracidiphilus sp.]|nr:glycosyltransferase 87 family protein [Terracidiphilus sp.]